MGSNQLMQSMHLFGYVFRICNAGCNKPDVPGRAAHAHDTNIMRNY